MERLGHVFRPLRIGSMELANRIVVPGMDPSFGIDDEGRLTEEFTAFMVERARSRPGMLVSPAMAVHPTGLADPATVHMLLISDQKVLPGLEGLVRAVHRHGVPFGAQLTHCGLGHLPALAVIPSERPPGTEIGPTRAATREDIQEFVHAFALAAERCIAAGFDFIEVHGAHAYLINEFLTPRYNRRTDEYGGPFENRIRFLLEVVREIRTRVGPGAPVGVRLSGDDFIGEDGWQLPELCRLAPILEKEGVDYVNITQGGFSFGTIQVNIAPMYEPQGAFVRFAAAVKKHVSIPVGTVGRIKDPEMADRIIKEGQADFVCMARAHLADPELVEKARRGDLADIRPCLGECLGCIEGIFRHASATCTVNPRVGREHAIPETEGDRSASPRRVLVAGGGAAGLEAARRAAFSGHRVTLCESRGCLGGQLRLAAMMPMRNEMADILPWYERQLHRLRVEVRLNTAIDAGLIDQLRPDVLVVATGSLPEASLGFIEGLGNVERMELMMVDELLEDRRPTGDTVLVVGGDQLGVEVADYLSEQGKAVHVVEAGPHFGRKLATNDRRYLMSRLAARGVKLYKRVEKVDILPGDEVWLLSAGQTAAGDGQTPARADRTPAGAGQRMKLPAIDTIVLAAERRPNVFLAEVAERKGIEVKIVGDAAGVTEREQGTLMAAIATGYDAGRQV